jgi:hypothetical protein
LLRDYGIEISSERVAVFRNGRRIGTLPADFDPMFSRSNSFLYVPRHGDLVREGDHWVVGRTMGAADIDCVVGFIGEFE